MAEDELVGAYGHVVPQVVKAELGVGHVGDVGEVGLAALRRGGGVLDHPHGEAQAPVDGPHPLGVAAGQVVVHRDHVDALAREGVQGHGQGGHQGLTLARLHLGDLALVEDGPADELDVKVAHAQVALGGLPGEGEGHGEKLVQGSPLLVLLLELPVGGGEVGELLHLGLEAVHRLHHLLVVAGDLPLVVVKEPAQKT